MADDRHDRTTQDVGNIVALEHVNVKVPDQQVATLFYVVGLGLTRDPYLMVGLDNMWINIGQQQFHLPTGTPQVLRGDVGLVIPDFDELPRRLAMVERHLGGTQVRLHGGGQARPRGLALGQRDPLPPARPGLRRDDARHAVRRVPGRARRRRRHRPVLPGGPSARRRSVTRNGGGAAARVTVGSHQELIFRETAEALPAYDGHHMQIYIADFSGPHRWLSERGLVTEESNWYQYRFQDIVEPDSGRVLFTIEHEVRSLRSPLYLRPLVNRNPAQRQPTYQRGRDAFVPGMS